MVCMRNFNTSGPALRPQSNYLKSCTCWAFSYSQVLLLFCNVNSSLCFSRSSLIFRSFLSFSSAFCNFRYSLVSDTMELSGCPTTHVPFAHNPAFVVRPRGRIFHILVTDFGQFLFFTKKKKKKFKSPDGGI